MIVRSHTEVIQVIWLLYLGFMGARGLQWKHKCDSGGEVGNFLQVNM